ncbi:MAG TPA: TonB-dependent receptor, partial [Allosphingosinicella sp.]|nr:TonB-dependent receptor [Allosphingosinicella sp.]
MNFRKSFLLGLLVSATPLPVHGQETPPPADEAPAEPGAAEESSDEEYTGQEIIVTGQRLRGAVAGDIPPEIQLDSRDIRAYGAGSLLELLEALGPLTRSGSGRGGGRPVVLLNGRRISGFSEIRDLPPEAIERVDILPEAVALKYGYRADQRVVNFVLRPRFRAVTGELAAGMATAGGRGSYEADFNVLRIMSNGRWNVDAEFRRDTPLFESERDLVQSGPQRPFALGGNIGAATAGGEIDPALSALAGRPVTVAALPSLGSSGAPPLSAFAAGADNPNTTDLGQFRTLLPETDRLSLAGTVNRTILKNVSATLNARYDQSLSKSRFGLPSATFAIPTASPFSPFASDVTLFRYYEGPRPLTRESDSRTGHLGVSLNGDMLPWRWSFTANYDRSNNRNLSDTNPDLSVVQARIVSGDPDLNPFAPLAANMIVSGPRERSRSLTRSGDAELVASGPLLRLPAGEVATSLKFGVDSRSLHSESNRGGVDQERDLARSRVNGQANLDVPIASRRNEVLSAIGDLSLNANAAVEHLSDFGTLRVLGGGLNWSPIKEVRVLASVTDEDGAPTIQQLGDPLTLLPNVRVFDFTRGRTVDISRLEGGNPDLSADNRRVLRLGLNVRPLEQADLSLSANYVSSTLRNLISSFPTATPQIEAAFRDRFVRDAQGDLLRIDSRPVNFERADRQELRWGANFSKPLPQTAHGGGPGGPSGAAGRGGWRGRAAEA